MHLLRLVAYYINYIIYCIYEVILTVLKPAYVSGKIVDIISKTIWIVECIWCFIYITPRLHEKVKSDCSKIFTHTLNFSYLILQKSLKYHFNTRWTVSESQHLSMETYGPKFNPKLTPICPRKNIDSKLKETYMLHYREATLCTRNHHGLIKSERCKFSSLESIRKWFGHLLSI